MAKPMPIRPAALPTNERQHARTLPRPRPWAPTPHQVLAARVPTEAPFRVAVGLAISCLHGIRAGGAQVSPSDFESPEAFDDLVRRGAITDREAGK